MTETENQVSLSGVIQSLKQELGKAEEIRASAGGEVSAEPRHETYNQAIERARSIFENASPLFEQAEDESEREAILLLVTGAASIVVSAYESQAKHTIADPEEQERALDEAVNWLEKLNPLIPALEKIETSLGGPVLWPAELLRNRARSHERRPSNRKKNLEKAGEYYQQAISVGKRKVKEAEAEGKKELLYGALSVTGVAMGELARVKDMLIHEVGEKYDEEEIQKLYVEGRNLVWQTRDIPNYDRLDAVEGRVFHYLQSHGVSPDHPDYRETIEHWVELALESNLVKDRMRQRIEQGIIPDQYRNLFENLA